MTMDWNRLKQSASFLPAVMLALTVLFAAGAAGKWMLFQADKEAIPEQISAAVTQSRLDEETTNKHLGRWKESADALKKDNMFKPKPPKPKMPSCTGIFGDMAIFGDKGYKVGESAQGAKILAVGGNVVTIEWEGKEHKLYPFATAAETANPAGPSRGWRGASREERGSRDGERERPQFEGPRGGPPQGRVGMMFTEEQRQEMRQQWERYRNASPEEQQQMREEFRARFGGPRGGEGRGGREGRGRRGG